MRKQVAVWMLVLVAAVLLLAGCGKEEVPQLTAVASVTVPSETLENVHITLPEDMSRKKISDIQDDFILNGQQVGGIVLVDVPKELLDSPRKGVFEIAERIRLQLMPDVPAKEADLISWGGCPNAYMELGIGPEEIHYFHYIFRGTAYTYDVWFNWNLLGKDSDTIYEIVKSVSGEDILPENNQNPF